MLHASPRPCCRGVRRDLRGTLKRAALPKNNVTAFVVCPSEQTTKMSRFLSAHHARYRLAAASSPSPGRHPRQRSQESLRRRLPSDRLRLKTTYRAIELVDPVPPAPRVASHRCGGRRKCLRHTLSVNGAHRAPHQLTSMLEKGLGDPRVCFDVARKRPSVCRWCEHKHHVQPFPQ